ncbi:MAG TPA: xanthine dehydrogenase family protein subunit M [candidate division Zixibacteria bacterium]|nr:xanthine dehydrogenase family protein subunit M [candidate division Zixibacteria bacterium]
MMPLRRFTIHQPKSVAEAAQMLAHYGDKARLYAGGTELLLAMKHDLLRYEHLVDVKTIPGLDRIEANGSALRIGSGATHRSIERSSLVRERLPVMAEMESQVANVRVRATGTLGGNLCFAEPHSDPATLLLALEATARIEGGRGTRSLPLDRLITGAYETALAPDELLACVEIPLSQDRRRAAYVKFQTHERPTLSLALVLELEDDDRIIKRARAAAGSVGARPSRSPAAESLLQGPRHEVEKRLPDAARALADAADPVDDLQGSAEYKRHLVGVFLKRAFARALA